MDLREKVLREYVQRLHVLGADYQVRLGELVFSRWPDPPAKQVRRGPRVHSYLWTHPIIEKMKPGASELFPLPEGGDLHSFQGAISGKACRLFGKGHFMTTFHKDKHAVELLVLGDPSVDQPEPLQMEIKA